MTTRILVLLGQGSYATSMGMVSLASRLKPFGETTIHSWSDPKVVGIINAATAEKRPTAAVAYSLGSNQLGFISRYLDRKADLGVAYDPSWLSPLVTKGPKDYYQTAPQFKKFLVYYNRGAWIWGGSTYHGSNVTEYSINNFHLAAQLNETLHQRTLSAIKELT